MKRDKPDAGSRPQVAGSSEVCSTPDSPRRSVQWQIMVRQLPLLALIFLGVLYWLGNRLEQALLSANLETARRSSLAVVYAVETSMLKEEKHRIWSSVVERIPREETTQIEIANRQGEILFSTDPSRMRMSRQLSDPLCAACHQESGEPPTRESTFIRDPQDARWQVLAAPLWNSEDCRSCHAEDESKLGMVIVSRSLDPIRKQVWSLQLSLAGVGAIILVLTLLLTRTLLGRYLNRPIKRLVEGARAIGAGQLESKIELPSQSELTILADTLNTSAGRIAGMIEVLERQRDGFRTLYDLVDQLGRDIEPEARRRRAVELASRILGRECVLVHATGRVGRPAGGGAITFRSGEGIVDHSLPDQGSLPELPGFVDLERVRQWVRGELQEVRARQGDTVTYGLQRNGKRLGLLLASASTPETDMDPDMVRALTKHLATALEFSNLQADLIQQERLAAVGETAAGLAHWLKNTLNGLRGGQFIIDRALDQGDIEKLQQGWRIVKRDVEQVEALTSDLLYCAKDRVPKREEVDLNGLVRDVVAQMNGFAAQHGVELVVESDSNVGREHLERDAMCRALVNLIANAIDACSEPDTGKSVVVRTEARPDETVIAVEDTGIGMTDAVQAIIFERFFSTKASKGTGLGLAIVKKVIEEHGGTVEATSTKGKGSSFRVHLPR